MRTQELFEQASQSALMPMVERGSGPTGDDLSIIYARVSTEKQVKKEIDPQGLSIPNQVTACERRSEGLGAEVAKTYVELGHTAKVMARPVFQELLANTELLRRVKYVIVYNLSRLTRSVEDQIRIITYLKHYGVELVSATETVDDTPVGKLMRNMMRAYNQFHSDNSGVLAQDGQMRKAMVGGTPYRAPSGYLNRLEVFEGRPVKTVVVDEDKAPGVVWAFEAFATGEWTTTTLQEGLAERGVHLAVSKVAEMLRNPYYLGLVPFKGLIFPGRHPALVSPELFDRVQQVLDSHNTAGEKRRKHNHYLKGSLWCHTCEARICVSQSRGKTGAQYLYAFCLGRHQKRTACRQRHVLIDAIEEEVERSYQYAAPPPKQVEALYEALVARLAEVRLNAGREVTKLRKRITTLREQQKRLLRLYLEQSDDMPADLLTDEQARLQREITHLEATIARYELPDEELLRTFCQAAEVIANCEPAYRLSGPQMRRCLNQLLFKRIRLNSGDIEETEPTDFLVLFSDPSLPAELGEAQETEAGAGELVLVGQVSTENPMERVTGIEPA